MTLSFILNELLFCPHLDPLRATVHSWYHEHSVQTSNGCEMRNFVCRNLNDDCFMASSSATTNVMKMCVFVASSPTTRRARRVDHDRKFEANPYTYLLFDMLCVKKRALSLEFCDKPMRGTNDCTNDCATPFGYPLKATRGWEDGYKPIDIRTSILVSQNTLKQRGQRVSRE